MKKTPLALVKELFGDKAGLVSAVEKFTSEDLWVGRTNKDKGLNHVSNAKLLRLHTIFTEVKDKFSTRAGLIDAIVALEKRSKDDGYKAHLGKFPVPRLYDLFKSTSKRHKAANAEKPAKKTPAEKAAVAAATAKKAAAKKAPVKKVESANAKKSALKKAAAKKG